MWVLGCTEPERGPEGRDPADPPGSALGSQAQAAASWCTGSGVTQGLSQPFPASLHRMREEGGLRRGRGRDGSVPGWVRKAGRVTLHGFLGF